MLGSEINLFGGDVVKRNSQGDYLPVHHKDFAGVSVALYFGRKGHPKCAAGVPVLKQFYLTTNDSYGPKNIEIIYVSLDEDEETFERARATMPWCSVKYKSDLRKNLISRYRVDDKTIPLGRQATLPSILLPQIIIIGPHGEEAGRLDLSKCGPEEFLLNWDYRYNRWPGTASVPATVTAWS